MDLDKLGMGERIAGVSSVLLFIFMFFSWFDAEVNINGSGASEGISAWDALDVIPIILVITIIAAIGVAVLRGLDSDFEVPPPANAVVAILGGVSFLLILYRIVDTPGASGSAPGFSFDVSPAFWIFVSLICAAGIAYGGYRAMQEEGMTFGELGDRFSSGGGPGGGGSRGSRPRSGAAAPPPPSSQPPASAPPSSEPPADQPPPPPPPPSSQS